MSEDSKTEPAQNWMQEQRDIVMSQVHDSHSASGRYRLPEQEQYLQPSAFER